jgi:hypothetical protein
VNVTHGERKDAARIQWFSQFDYDDAILLARRTHRPILLVLHSESSKGCVALDEAVFSQPAAAEKIMRYTVPVRVNVDTKEADPITSFIVGSHIFIWSQTVQLVSPDGDIHHKFLGAPRHTRLDMGYTRVHHDVHGAMSLEDFLAQLQVGLGKEALFRGNYDGARELLATVPRISGANALAREEAAYWTSIAEGRGCSTSVRRPTAAKAPLAQAVEAFCAALVRIPDSELMLDWHGKKPAGDWAHYTDCLREVVFGTYQAMLGAAQRVAGERVAEGCSPTQAQRLLHAHHVAYRELQGLVVGLQREELDGVHLRENRSLGKQRTIRNNLVHCVMAEWWAHAPAVRGTLKAVREGRETLVGTAEETIARFGEPPNNFGDIETLIEASERAHRALIEEFQGITDEEVDARARWWEGSPVSIRFRLGRFGWHLHDHAMVIETILERIGRKRTETERLARFVHRALGELEGSLIGLSPVKQEAATAELSTMVRQRADELERLADECASRGAN